MFQKGQKVEMTTSGLNAIRLDSEQKIRTHKNGAKIAPTGVVLGMHDEDPFRVVVRLDSQPKSSKGISYDMNFWSEIKTQSSQCYTCDCESDQKDVVRTFARGPREGQTVGPICSDCEQYMETKMLLVPKDKASCEPYSLSCGSERCRNFGRFSDPNSKFLQHPCRGCAEQPKPVVSHPERCAPEVKSEVFPFEPDYSTPPAETLIDIFEDRKMSHMDAAKAMCDGSKDLFTLQENLEFIKSVIHEQNTIIQITEEMAGRLAILGSTPQFWMNLFNNHNEFLDRQKNGVCVTH